MLDDRTTFAPLALFEYEDAPGRYCLMMAEGDWDDTVDVFEECGAYGNGHGWGGIARQVVRAHLPNSVDEVDFSNK
ncbi:Imm51 family immunity protein [Micromonospora chersina]|uniref:Imm51 family immunity protein n=1 Tax=Micromonospora chersina TaxID=47854 RepID=UPI0033CD2A87